jgi:hypothetical protein
MHVQNKMFKNNSVSNKVSEQMETFNLDNSWYAQEIYRLAIWLVEKGRPAEDFTFEEKVEHAVMAACCAYYAQRAVIIAAHTPEGERYLRVASATAPVMEGERCVAYGRRDEMEESLASLAKDAFGPDNWE